MKRVASIIFILLAGLMVLTVTSVPHHHHGEWVYVGVENCPEDHHDGHHDDGCGMCIKNYMMVEIDHLKSLLVVVPALNFIMIPDRLNLHELIEDPIFTPLSFAHRDYSNGYFDPLLVRNSPLRAPPIS